MAQRTFLLLVCSLVLLRATGSAAAAQNSCAGRCGKSKSGDHTCSCDYYCEAYRDCCEDLASACPSLVPSLDKPQLINCGGTTGVPLPFTPGSNVQKCASYRPGQCWCDSVCGRAGDCCNGCDPVSPARCPKTPEDFCKAPAAATRRKQHAVQTASSHAQQQQQGNADSSAGKQPPLDCGLEHRLRGVDREVGGSVSAASATTAIVDHYPSAKQVEYEQKMQKCQVEDAGRIGPPARIVLHIYWYATVVCPSDGSPCYGGDYSVDLVKQQIGYLNAVYSRHRMMFVWNQQITKVYTNNSTEVVPCGIGDTHCYEHGFLCTKVPYQGDKKSVRVITVPDYLYGDGVLGSANEPNLFQPVGDMLDCGDYAVIYEKTLPGLGAVSSVDGGPADNGQVLAHEIGHYFMIGHTWYGGKVADPIPKQCEINASEDPLTIIRYLSDGVRDTPPQSLNGSYIEGVSPTSIIRFLNCDQKTGAYTNSSVFAQKSCSAEHGFPAGEKYYNNYNNIMSYGDMSCLKTFTPGQGARARCAWKCLRKLDASC